MTAPADSRVFSGPLRASVAAGAELAPSRPWASRFATKVRLAYEYVVFYGLLLIFGVSSLVWSVVCAALYWVLPRRAGAPLGQFMVMAGFRYFVGLMRLTGIIKCDLTALDVLRGTSSVIIAPNHPTLLDAVLVISRLPRVVCTAKAELLKNPFLGGSARLAGFLRNDVATHLVREASRQLRAGRQLLIFPEGTRTRSEGVDAFKGGFALIARQADATVQTVFIESNSRFLGKGWPLLKKPEFPLVYRVRLGSAFTVEGDLRDFVSRLHDYYRDELAASAS
jgi:1-acyl-sn-glycerol-3-phosphate acyltransferase